MAGTKVDYTSKYLEKVNSRLAAVNGQDPFYEFCKNAVDGGDNVFFQKYRMETRLFDFGWVDTVEEALDKIDNVVRNPKSFIKEDNEVVPIEKAKRTGYEAVKHLSSHSQFVKEVTAEGFVKPSKILTTERNIDYAIYENRFVKTLLLKLVPFVEKRYDALVKLMNSDYFNKLNSKSKFTFNGTDVEYELNMSIHRKITDGDKAEHNELLLERAKIVRQRVLGFYTSEFMTNLAGAREVFPPIQRTNILMKEPNYHKCYQLWSYLSEQGDFKYEIDVKEAEVDFSKEYKEEIKNLTLLAYAVSAANDPAYGNAPFDKNVFVPIKPKEMKVLKNIDEEAQDNSLKMETDIINEFYYQEARKLYRKNIDSMVNDGEPYHIALKDVYMQSTKITDAIFTSLLEVPEDIKNNPVALLRFKKRKLESFKAIIKFKEQDLNKWRKSQAKLENEIIKDTVKANIALGIKDKATLEKEKKAAEQVLAKERAKEQARIAREHEKIKAREAIERAKAKEIAKKAKEAEQLRLAKEAARQAKEDERVRKAMERAEREKELEEKRRIREEEMAKKKALAEIAKAERDAKAAEKAKLAEEKRLEEEAKKAEEEKLAKDVLAAEAKDDEVLSEEPNFADAPAPEEASEEPTDESVSDESVSDESVSDESVLEEVQPSDEVVEESVSEESEEPTSEPANEGEEQPVEEQPEELAEAPAEESEPVSEDEVNEEEPEDIEISLDEPAEESSDEDDEEEHNIYGTYDASDDEISLDEVTEDEDHIEDEHELDFSKRSDHKFDEESEEDEYDESLEDLDEKSEDEEEDEHLEDEEIPYEEAVKAREAENGEDGKPKRKSIFSALFGRRNTQLKEVENNKKAEPKLKEDDTFTDLVDRFEFGDVERDDNSNKDDKK